MPLTAYTMLVGCLAIIGAGIPFVGRLQRLLLERCDPRAGAVVHAITIRSHRVLFFVAAGGAAITAFYMFRLWYLTFAGEPRDHHVYEHAHESPKVMYLPLVVLAVFAFGIGWPMWGLTQLVGTSAAGGHGGNREWGGVVAGRSASRRSI